MGKTLLSQCLIFIFVIVLSFSLSASWEFIGPGDSSNISNLYSFGKGYIIAFEGDDKDRQSQTNPRGWIRRFLDWQYHAQIVGSILMEAE